MAAGVPGAASGQLPTNSFTQPFDWTTNLISTLPATNWGIFIGPQPVTIATAGNAPVTVFDWYGNAVYSGAPTSMAFATGHYFIECNGDRNEFCVLPADYSGASFLGAGATTNVPWGDLQKEQAMGVQWIRCWSGLWDSIAVSADTNTWDWSAMDAVVAANPGRKIMATAANYGPAWVTNSFYTGAGNTMASYLPAYLQYLQVLATRYKGRLAAIEIWNEPWFDKFGYGGCPPCSTNFYATLARFSTQGAALVNSIDPNIQILAPVWDGPNHWTDTGLWTQFGGPTGVDVLGWHDYENFSWAPDALADGSDQKMDTVSMVRQAAAGFSGPIEVSELGLWADSALGFPQHYGTFSQTPAPDWATALSRTIKSFVMYRAAGAEVLMPQSLVNTCTFSPGWNSLGGWEYSASASISRGPHPKTTGLLMTCYWLNAAQLVDYRTWGQQVFLYAWQQTNNNSVVFAWTLEGQSVPLNNPPAATDIFGHSIPATALTSMPFLFQSSTLSASALLSNVMAAVPASLNVPPVFPTISDQAVLRGQPLQFSVSAIDSNHNPLTYSASPLPPGASLNPTNGLFSWTPQESQIGAWPITFTATDDQGLSASASNTVTVTSSITDGLVHEWNFDEDTGATANDSAGSCTGSLENFSFNSSDGWVPGVIGSALKFDGGHDYVTLNNDNLILTNGFTISAWLNPADASGDGSFLSFHSSYQASGLRFYIDNNTLLVQGQTTAGWQFTDVDPGAFQNGSWVHIAVVYDKSIATVYVNGISQGSANWGGDVVMNPALPSYLGMDEQASYFHGDIDEMMVYSRPLGPQEILELYQTPGQPPAFTATGPQYTSPGQTLTFTVSATDPHGNPLGYSAAGLPPGASFDPATQTFTWTPGPDQLGNDTVTFIASNGLVFGTEQVPITVAAAPVITAPPSVTNAALQIGDMAVVVAGDPAAFNVGAVNPGGGALSYTWSFGDGAAGGPYSDGAAGYSYTNGCGAYTASVMVDNGVYTNSASLSVSVACQLEINKLQGSLNFARTNADTCTLQGRLDLPADFSFAGKRLVLGVGGARMTAFLDARGQTHTGAVTFPKPVYNKRTGRWTFTATLRDCALQSSWAAYGASNQTVANPGLTITNFPVIVVVGDQSFMGAVSLRYTAKQNRSGTLN